MSMDTEKKENLRDSGDELKDLLDEIKAGSVGGSGENEALAVDVVEKCIFQLESIGNEFLRNYDDRLGFEDHKIRTHSKLLSVVLKKHFSPDVLAKSPEAVLLFYTSTLAAQQFMIIKQIKEEKEKENV